MANTVETQFKVTGVQQALKDIADYKKAINDVGKNSVLTTQKSLPAKTDNYLQKALADIQKYQNQQLNFEKQLTRQIEREAEAQYQAKVKSIQKANQAFLKAANPQNSIRGQVGSALNDLGLGNLGALASAAGPAAAIGATLAVVGAAVSKTVDTVQLAIEKSIAADKANRLLSASATEAGKSYAFLAEKNQKFAESVGLSNVAAASTTAKIAQLATFGGDTSTANIDRLLKAFANLSAARGIDSKDIETLVGSIISGQDEGLNRLGIADPSKLYEQYAKSIGTTADKLNQFQKVQAATNAVVEKAGTFAGAADARMNSLEGATNRTTAAWENFTTSLSKSFTESSGMVTILNSLAATLKSVTSETDVLQKKISEGNLKPSDVDKAGNNGYLRRTSSKLLGAGALLSLFSPQGNIANYLSGGKFQENASLLFNSDINADINKQKLQQQINAQILADAQQKKAAEEAARDLRQKIADDTFKVNQSNLLSIVKTQQSAQSTITDAFYAEREAKLKTHLDTTKKQEINTLREVGQVRVNAIQQQINDTQENFRVLLSTQSLSATEEIKLRTETNAQIVKLNSELAIAQIENQKQIAQKEKEIIEERKKAQKQIIDSQTNLFQLRTGGNPYVSIFDEARKALDNFTESFKDATPQQVAEFKKIQAEITRTKVEIQDFQNKIASQKYRNQAFDLRGLQPTDINGFGRRISGLNDVLGYSAETYNYNLLANQSYQLAANPFRTQDKALTELNNYQNQWTKFDDLAKNFGNLGIYGQAAIASAKMNLLPDGQSLLELSQQGNRQAQYALYQQGNLQSILAQASDQKLSDTLSKNSFLDQRTKYYSDQLKEAQAAVNRGSRVPLGDRLDNLLNVYDALGTENLTPQQLQEKFNALEAKAAQIERQKQEANKFYETMNRITNLERGLKVDFGNQTPFQVEVQSQSPIQLTLPKR